MIKLKQMYMYITTDYSRKMMPDIRDLKHGVHLYKSRKRNRAHRTESVLAFIYTCGVYVSQFDAFPLMAYSSLTNCTGRARLWN